MVIDYLHHVYIAVDGSLLQKNAKYQLYICKCCLREKKYCKNNNGIFIPTMSAQNNMDPFYHPSYE